MKPRRSTPGDLAYAHIRREEIAQANADAHVRQLTRKYPDLRPEEIARFREESPCASPVRNPPGGKFPADGVGMRFASPGGRARWRSSAADGRLSPVRRTPCGLSGRRSGQVLEGRPSRRSRR